MKRLLNVTFITLGVIGMTILFGSIVVLSFLIGLFKGDNNDE